MEQCVIAKVGSDPELFVIVYVATLRNSSNKQGQRKGITPRQTTNGLTENELRRELEKKGYPKPEIDDLIQRARERSGI